MVIFTRHFLPGTFWDEKLALEIGTKFPWSIYCHVCCGPLADINGTRLLNCEWAVVRRVLVV